MLRPLIVLAHGAGAPSTSPWMQGWAKRLDGIGHVHAFDYPYLKDRRRHPDPHSTLVRAHREAIATARSSHDGPLFLAGKSMGSRIGCHVAAESDDPVRALICLGYPLKGLGGRLRDSVLMAIKCPILFVQGTRDALCPIDLLEETRTRMTVLNELMIIDDGDHSLAVTKTALRARQETQDDVDRRILERIRQFVRAQVS